jgi:tetratricopeptide (TPR) repeat protein
LDYAETRTEILLAILAALVSQTSLSPIRVLLLARSSGEWWAQLPAENARCEALLDGFATTGPYTLPPLYAELNERNHAFTQALAAFSQALQLAEPQIHPDLNAEQFHSPLYLQMAALLTLLGEHTPNAELLPQSLVRHEQRYWRRMGAGSDSEANLLMSLTTLVGYAPTVRAVEPLWLAAGGHPASLKPLFASLSPLYPAQQGLGALQPDLLGEALIASQVLGLSGAALLDAALGEKASSAQRAHALTALARLLRYRADLSSPLQIALCKHFTRCAQALFQVCIQTPGPLSLVAEQSFKQLTPALARQVAGQLESNFEHEVLPLAGLELLIRETLNTQALHRCQKPNHSMDDRSALGSTLQNLSMAHFQLGNSADALEFAKQALDIHERVAKDKPERFEPDLAGSLNNYANRLTEIGETTQALVFSKQALHIHERLAKDKPERFEPNWAMSLNNYAHDLAKIGDTTQALVFSKQALHIYERLAKDKPERFEPDWAISLGNCANRLAEIGDTTQALVFSKQELRIYERLAKNKPERFEPDLAGSLNNYANRLTEIGETTQALVFSKQALHIYERLAKNKPERFEPNLAMSLNNYANDLAEIGDTTQALVFSKQALDIYERLAKDKPERFEPDWAMSLNNYANHLAAAGDATQALARAKQALDIYERLVKHRPMKFDIDVQAGKLMVALWKWLADKTPLLVAPIEEIDGSEVPYKMRPVCFFRQVLHALGTEQASEKAAAFAAVWERWHVMSKAQQTRWEHTFLLACAYAEANTYLPQHLGGWRLQINALNTRRNGNLPKWMLQVAERQGFSLGIDA